MLECFTESADETRSLGRRIGAALGPGSVILLFGGLGAGKTTFVQGLAYGMGIEGPVTSPTFTLIQEYRIGDRRLVHIDPYRLSTEEDLLGIGLDEYLESGSSLAVEWSERLGSLMPVERLDIRLERMEGDRRRIVLEPVGERYARTMDQVGPC